VLTQLTVLIGRSKKKKNPSRCRIYGSWSVAMSDEVKQLSSIWRAIRVTWKGSSSSSWSSLSSFRRRSVVHHLPATVLRPWRHLSRDGVVHRRCTVWSASVHWREDRPLCGWVSPTPPCICCRRSSPTTCLLQQCRTKDVVTSNSNNNNNLLFCFSTLVSKDLDG